jgi:septal ring factor EnvC (AmiA/AmiB activator)
MFIFSAKDFSQMYRRLRFIREYAAYQRVQGEMVKSKQAQVTNKHHQMERVKGQKNNKLYQGQKEKSALEGKQNEQQTVVSTLQTQQKTIQKVIADQKKKDAALNAQIDNLIAQEVAKARARAAAEARRKTAAAAAAKQRAAELAAKKAAAAAEARENARRIAEAKKREAEMKAEARAAAERRNAAEQARADQLAREAEADRKAAELKARTDEVRSKKVIAEAREDAAETQQLSTVDRMMSGGFQANRGRLPMPITGNYKIVSHFGQYNVEGLRNVTLDNKGINILGSPGCRARAIYDGEVSSVFGYGGTWGVLVRHGDYISVYCNLRSVSVSTGQKVSARQVLGVVGTDNILQFQLRKEMSKLNPEAWLSR